MSKFHTTIPTHIEEVLKSLPEGSHVHGITVGEDKKTIVLSWENDHWRTPYSVPMEVTPEALAGKEPIPGFVKDMTKPAETGEASEKTSNRQAKPKGAKPKAAKGAKKDEVDPGTSAESTEQTGQ